MKRIVIGFGYVFGSATPIVIDWGHIAQKVIETCFVSFFAGALGAAGGLFLYWLNQKYFKIKKHGN